MSKRLSLIRRLECFLASERGKRILNYFYSWGAAFVILGALFKLLHIRYGDEILLVSMLTEFAVFFISGFERPEIGSKGSESSDKAYPPSAIPHQQHQPVVTSTDLPQRGLGYTDTLTSNYHGAQCHLCAPSQGAQSSAGEHRTHQRRPTAHAYHVRGGC